MSGHLSVVASEKKGKLFERSEFFPFPKQDVERSTRSQALTFWFFCVKAKEQKKTNNKGTSCKLAPAEKYKFYKIEILII